MKFLPVFTSKDKSRISLTYTIPFPSDFISGLQHCIDQVMFCTPGFLFKEMKDLPEHSKHSEFQITPGLLKLKRMLTKASGANEKKKANSGSTQFFKEEELKKCFADQVPEGSFFVQCEAGTWYQATRSCTKNWEKTVENSLFLTETVAGEAF
jgi:hypothetical protein